MSLADAGLNSAQAENERNKKPVHQFPTKVRQCLRCDKDFKSQGPSNRICDECNQINLRLGRRSNHETNRGHQVTHSTPR